MAMIQGEFCQLDLDVSTPYAKKVFLMRCKCLVFLGCLRRASGLGAIYYGLALDDLREPDLGPEILLSHEHDADRINAFISHLRSIDHRNVAFLALCREANPTEISQQTGISRAQVYRYLAEIRSRLETYV